MPRHGGKDYVSYIEALEEVSKRIARTYTQREETATLADRLHKLEHAFGDLEDSIGDLESSNPSGDSTVGEYKLPPATKKTLGGVKIGDGVDVESDGTISVGLTGLASKEELDSVKDRVDTLEKTPPESPSNPIQISVNGEIQNEVDGVVELTIPKKLGDLENDLNYQTREDVLEIVSEKVGEGGEINGIIGVKVNGVAQPEEDNMVDIFVPTKVSELNNDEGYITNKNVSGIIDEKIGPIQDQIGNIEEVLDRIEGGSGEDHDPIGDKNVIEEIRVNGVKQEPVEKVVDLTVPMKVSDLENDRNFQTEANVDQKIATKLGSVYRIGGSLPSPPKSYLKADYVGYVFNISMSFTADEDFLSGGDETYPAGTNIVIVKTAPSLETYKFDILSGLIDTSIFVTQQDVADFQQLANSANTTANEAKEKAESAETNATAAVQTANEAKATADSIKPNILDVVTSAEAIEFFKDIFLSGAVPYGKELTESWATIQTRIKEGNFSGIHVGDYKTITLTGGEQVVMEVAGIDQYYKCGDQEIRHHIDFISRDCLTGTKVFNDTNTNNGTEAEPNPWRASKLFKTLNEDVWTRLPDDLKSCIIEKRALLESRYSATGAVESDTGLAWNNMGKLWLPTEVEVFGNIFWSDGDSGWPGGGGCNLQYPIFYGGVKHIIKGAGNGGGRCGWWGASARRRSSSHVCGVGGYGDSYGHAVMSSSVFAPLCFRIG